MPDDLVVQVPRLKQILAALRIATAEFLGYEADDVIASLASQAAGANLQTASVTTDKDLLQLVDEKTFVWNPAKERTIKPPDVEAFIGVEAGQVVDLLSLSGDPSDNVPGVPGIGEKTAKSLIQEFGSLDNLLENAKDVKNLRIRAKLEAPENRDLLELSRRLVTVCRDLDLDLDLDRYAVQPPDEEETIRLFGELEFSRILTDFLKAPRQTVTNFRTITDEAELAVLAKRIDEAGRVAVDTETDSPAPTRARLVGLSFSLRPGEASYVPVGHD